jgi:hypothetical protein
MHFDEKVPEILAHLDMREDLHEPALKKAKERIY